uniref:Uncharacterized mitochondrial protein AtMg00810-like n=1 Tax=Tanacetum cinerariifolium TaxID=118510 RepID=A0A6L2M7Z5_TANCI|nr:uncharacterized mitochondrial protein AtMg00810-like [Tanacetum cinerariifolium]
MFTDEQPPDYSFPLRIDVYPDDFLEIEFDANFDDDSFDSQGEKIKEAELLIDPLDLPCDILSEYDSFNSQDFSKDEVLPSPDNEDKVFNPGILSHEKSVKIITRVTQEKKLAVSYASLLFEDFDPSFYELLAFKEVSNSMRLFPFSFENEEKVSNQGFTLLRSFIAIFSLNYLIQLSSVPGFMKILANGFHYFKSSLSLVFNLGIMRRYKSTITTNRINRSPTNGVICKLPILKKGEYILWTMKMEQYLAHTYYALWEVILNGNSAVQRIKDEAGNEVEVPPITAQQILARKKERKSKSTLLMAIPHEHLARIHGIKVAKTLWAAIKTRFGGNSESKKMKKNAQGFSSYADELMFSFFANQSSSPQLDNKDLEKIDQDDLEEMDLKWQAAMLSMRVKRFYKPATEENENALVAQDGLGTYDYSYQVEEEAADFALMAFTSNSSSSSSSNLRLDEAFREKEELKAKLEKFETSLKNLTKLLDSQISAKVKTGLGYDSRCNEKEVLDAKEEEVTETVFDNRISDEENSLDNDRFKKSKGYHALPPPLTGNYTPPKFDLSFAGLDDYIYKVKISETVTSLTKDEKDAPETSTACVEKPKEDRSSAPLIQDWDTDSDNDSIFRPEHNPTKIDFIKAVESVKHVKPVKYVNPDKPLKLVKTAEQTEKSKNFTHSRRNSTKRVNTVGSKADSAVKGNRITAVKTLAGFVWRPRVNDIDQISNDNRWICTRVDYGHPHQALKNKGIVDSGCSRHMTRNEAYLANYQEINDGGFVAFGSSKGKITGKGLPSKIFENDHTCVAYQKGKRHKATCKAKLVSLISQPLQMLHMDLFGPTSVMSINHKKYCLVVIDDFSRALVTKSHNKTSYELLNGRTPRLDFIRPFGCPVTILNTPDLLGKFKDKTDEGFFVGYSVTSKAFKVFNTKTRKVEENLHVRFLENKPNVAGTGPNWLFDIDSLTNSMNYIPVSAGIQTNKNTGPQDTNGNAGTQDNVDAGKDVFDQHYIVLPLWSSISSTFKSSDDKAVNDKPKDDTGSKTIVEPVNKEDQAYRDELDMLISQEKEASNAADALRMEFELGCMDQSGATKAANTNNFLISLGARDVEVRLTMYSINHQPPFIQKDLNLKLNSNELMIEQRNKLFKAAQSMIEEYRQREQAAKLSIHTPEPSRCFNYICYDDDDDYDYKESTLPLNEINSQIPLSIVIITSPLVLPIEDHEDSLIMGNEELNTIPEKESDEFIKSSVEDLVPIPSESEDTFGSDSECILPSDDESLSDEDVPKDNVKIYLNPLFEFDDEYISSDVNTLFNEVLEDIECKDSYDPNLDESTFLVTPLFDSNEDEYFTLGDDVKLLLHHDLSIPKMSVASILERFTDELPLEENDDLFDLKSENDEWKKILYDAQIDDLMSKDKVFDPEIHDQIFSPTYMSSMEELTFFLGLQVKQSEEEIFISQDKYVAEILKKFDFSSVKTASTPIETQKPLVKDEEATDVDVHLYRSMIGSLIYLTASRPDIMFAVCACFRFQVTPKLSHIHAVKRIFRYLKGQPKLGLWYPRDTPFDLEAYSDSDYAGANLDRNSTTGGCQFLGRRLILWQWKKQTIVATSTTEAEYVAATNCYGQATLNEPTPQGEGPGSGPKRQETMGGAMAQIRSEGVLIQSIDPLLSTGYTVRRGEEKMEHDIELTDPMPQTPYDSPLSGDKDADTEMIVEDKGNGEKGGSTAEIVSTARPDISAARQEVSTTKPKTPPTTATLFEDEDVTIADTLVKMKNQKSKEKEIAFKDADNSARPIRSITTLQPLPTIDLKDKDLDKEARTERERQEKASKATLAEMYDEIQAQIDADHELAVRLTHEEQEKYTVKKGSEEDEKRVGSRKKRAAGSSLKHKSPKKQKVNDQESKSSDKEHRKILKVVPDDDKAIDYETLDVKSPIVDCESQVLGTNKEGNVHVYKLTRLDGSYRHFSTFSRMLEVLDRQDVLDLHKIIMERFPVNDPKEYDLIL